MHRISKTCVLVCSLVIAGYPRTVQGLKDTLAAFLPSGKVMRFVLLEGGQPGNFDTHIEAPENGDMGIYTFTSNECVIRKVFPGDGQPTGAYSMLNITADGERVIFQENDTRQVFIVKLNPEDHAGDYESTILPPVPSYCTTAMSGTSVAG